jgi:hypothetical protein
MTNVMIILLMLMNSSIHTLVNINGPLHLLQQMLKYRANRGSKAKYKRAPYTLCSKLL